MQTIVVKSSEAPIVVKSSEAHQIYCIKYIIHTHEYLHAKTHKQNLKV